VSDVTESDSTVTKVGQGVVSMFGYLRGDISGDTWQGEYFMAGLEARHGTFSFTLASDGLSYSGSFTESVGFSYGMAGDKLSSVGVVPKDTDCFKTDDVLLMKSALNTEYQYTSNALATNIASNSTQDRVAYTDANSHVSVSWTASFGIGFNYGPSFVAGQVACAQWYEGNAAEGIELFVAKDMDSFYSIWLMSSTVSMFNYTQVVEVDKSYGVEINVMLDKLATAEQGMEFSFLRLLTTTDESTCSNAMAGDSMNCDDDDEAVVILIVFIAVLLVVGLAILFSVMYLGVCRKQTKMSESEHKVRI